MAIASLMPTNHLILCPSLLLLPWIFPSIKVFSNESVLHIRWPKYWSFSWSPLRLTGLISLQSKGLSRVFSSTTVQKHQFFSTQMFFGSNLTSIHTMHIMRNARLDEAQAGIKITRRNINNLRYADDTTLMAENKKELKRLLMTVNEESEKLT